MMAMFTRLLPLPERTFFLFGPRGTGKTTWLRQVLPEALWVNLLLEREILRLVRDPGRFRQEVEARPSGTWVVVDEVQRMPSILDEVHDILTAHPRRWRFALTGSSARKLRGAEANLLAGRAIGRRFFPLTLAEIATPLLADEAIAFGMLPLIRSETARDSRIDLLEAYVETYLAQEVRAEALVRRLEPFVRFLSIAALANAQVTNLASLARDAGVSRPTVQGYLEVLTDTLIAVLLPAWRPRARVKEVAHPKLYLFDSGVARALSGRLREPLESAERGRLLETWVLSELRAHSSIANIGGEISYWRTPSGSEVDFVWSRGRRAVGIEVKASTRWRAEDGDSLAALLAERAVQHAFGVYLGDRPLVDRATRVLPVAAFLAELAAGRVLD